MFGLILFRETFFGGREITVGEPSGGQKRSWLRWRLLAVCAVSKVLFSWLPWTSRLKNKCHSFTLYCTRCCIFNFCSPSFPFLREDKGRSGVDFTCFPSLSSPPSLPFLPPSLSWCLRNIPLPTFAPGDHSSSSSFLFLPAAGNS